VVYLVMNLNLCSRFVLKGNWRDEMGGAYSAYGERRGVHRVFMRKPEEKTHLRDPGVERGLILG
jgi:hypothetical protein